MRIYAWSLYEHVLSYNVISRLHTVSEGENKRNFFIWHRKKSLHFGSRTNPVSVREHLN